MVRAIVCLMLWSCLCLPTLAWAGELETYTIVIREHKFEPAQLNILAGQKVKLVIDNQDPTAEEFESFELNREKVVAGGKKIIIYVGPLKLGSYKYFGEFHPQTAQGIIVAQ